MDQQFIKIIEKHPLIIRITHWLNVIMLSLMIWSGILIYWADQAFVVIPDKVSEALNIHHRLAEGMGWHFFIMWPLVINGFFYFLYGCLSGKWKERFVKRGVYNPAQRVIYPCVFLMASGSVLTGLAIYKPVQLGSLVEVFGGYKMARKLHFYLMVSLIGFVIVHVTQVLRSGWNNLRSMIAGYEIEE